MASTPTRQRVRIDRLGVRCESQKICYATRALALEGAERAMEAGRVSPGCHLMPYACDRCSAWHIRNQRIVPIAPEDLSRRDYRREGT